VRVSHAHRCGSPLLHQPRHDGRQGAGAFGHADDAMPVGIGRWAQCPTERGSLPLEVMSYNSCKNRAETGSPSSDRESCCE
jgi:hypothetical protein